MVVDESGQKDGAGHLSSVFNALFGKYEGTSMKITIRAVSGYQRCKGFHGIEKCDIVFSTKNKFHCAKHDRSVERIYLEIRDYGTKERYEIYDWRGIKLTLENAATVIGLLKEADAKGTFNIKHFLATDLKRLRFDNYVAQYLDYLQNRVDRGDFSRHNLYNIKNLFKKHFEFFAEHDIRDIKRLVIYKWLESCPEKTNGTKNRCMKALREMLGWALENEDISSTFKMPMITIAGKIPPALTQEQQDAFIKKAMELDPRHVPIWRFMKETGHRLNVIRALKVKDIIWADNEYKTERRFDHDILRDGLKTRKRNIRLYPLDRVRDIIKQALQGRVVGPESFVFEYKSENTGEYIPYTKDYLYSQFIKVRNATGLPKEITPNAFCRHSMASQLAEGGAHDSQISDVLDNSTATVRRNYKTVWSTNVGKIYDLRDRGKKKDLRENAGNEE